MHTAPRDCSTDDSELVRRIQDGETELYRVLVDRYAPMILRLARRFAAHPADAEDLAQDAFTKAYDSLHRFKDGTDFRAWLYTLSINLCRDYAKNIRRAMYPMSEVEVGEYRHAMSTAPVQHRELELTDRAESLRWALSQLPTDYCTAFLMKYEEGMRYKDIAAITGDSVGALKVRVHRARQELQKLLEDKL